MRSGVLAARGRRVPTACFVDRDGVRWTVRAVVTRVTRPPAGWSRCVRGLRFEAAVGARQLEGAPAGWDTLGAAALERLCREAIDPRRHRRLEPLV